ncbi:MAG: spore germination protein GerPC [Bacillota bacterium]
MNAEIYQYMKDLHTFIEYQARKLQKLENSVNALQKEVANLKERPPVQVGNIEYKFDQLKVETLEGTLNIGLNPSDLAGITDFTVDNKNIQTPNPSPKTLFKRSMEIENEIRDYLEGNLPEIYQVTKEKLQMNVDDSYYQFIREDILKQLPNRVHTHLSNLKDEEREDDENTKQRIVENIKKEIQQGVYLFLEQVYKQTEGESN